MFLITFLSVDEECNDKDDDGCSDADADQMIGAPCWREKRKEKKYLKFKTVNIGNIKYTIKSRTRIKESTERMI